MTKTERLALIKSRFAAKPSLSKEGADLIEELRKEDADLGLHVEASLVEGEDEKWETEETVAKSETEDEAEYNVTVLSPGFAECFDDGKKLERRGARRE